MLELLSGNMYHLDFLRFTMQEKFDMVKQDFQFCWRNSLTKVVTAAVCFASLRLSLAPSHGWPDIQISVMLAGQLH